MKNTTTLFTIAVLLSACAGQVDLPTVRTDEVTDITYNSATVTATVTDDGGAPIEARGVCYSTSPQPSLDNGTCTSNDRGTGTFSAEISNLSTNTTYYTRAYATNSEGTGYANELTFDVGGPQIYTGPVTDITNTTAMCQGSVSGVGSQIQMKGICWSTQPNPTLNDNYQEAGSGTGNYTSNLTGLSSNTTYYARAYATTSAGTAYGNELSFTTWSDIVSTPGAGVTFNGYTYTSVVLGNGREWMAENLRTTTYANGDPIPNVTDSTQWENLTTGAWAHYNNDSQYENPYGKLYNGYTVVDSRNVCPTGWHVPTDAEWTILSDYLGGESVAGGKMKSTGTQYWQSPNTAATNESGFSGLPGSWRLPNGSFNYIIMGTNGFWWSSSTTESGLALGRKLANNNGTVSGISSVKSGGFSVRCLRD